MSKIQRFFFCVVVVVLFVFLAQTIRIQFLFCEKFSLRGGVRKTIRAK